MRLYVARVTSGASAAAVAAAGALGTPADAERVFLRARFPGESGNGRVTVREIFTAATRTMMDAAAEDALIRLPGPRRRNPPRLFRKVGADWRDSASTVFTLPDGGNVVGDLISLLVSATDGDGEAEEYAVENQPHAFEPAVLRLGARHARSYPRRRVAANVRVRHR